VTYTIRLYGTPTSLNTLMHAHWRKMRNAKKTIQAEMETLLMAESVPRNLSHVSATADLYFKQGGKRRDEGNFRFLLEKALGDALDNGGWITDDTPDYFDFGEVRLHDGPREQPYTLVHLEVTR
jgi:hypothetical protein